VQLFKILCLSSVLAVTAQAQEYDPARFFLSLGYSVGGDTLATAQYTNGTSGSVRAGSGGLLQAGIDIRLNPYWGLQGSVGFQQDSQNATNGSIAFTRYPIEALAFFYPRERFRIGAGVRKAVGATLGGSGVGNIGTVDFDSSLGTVVECEFLTRHRRHGQFGLSLRYVSENFTANGMAGAPTVNGDHFGFGMSWYF
jgi:hypothetical protein